MNQLNSRVAGACFAQLLLLVFMYEDYSSAQWAIHKALLLAITLLLLRLTYQAFVQQRPVLALAAALASFPGLAFVLFLLNDAWQAITHSSACGSQA